MNDEQSKRLSEATEGLILANDALRDAREALADPRFERDLDRDRLAAAQQMGSKVDAASKRVEDAIRRSTVAAASNGRPTAWARYQAAVAKAREGRAKAKSVPDSDGVPARRVAATEGVELLDAALALAAALALGD